MSEVEQDEGEAGPAGAAAAVTVVAETTTTGRTAAAAAGEGEAGTTTPGGTRSEGGTRCVAFSCCATHSYRLTKASAGPRPSARRAVRPGRPSAPASASARLLGSAFARLPASRPARLPASAAALPAAAAACLRRRARRPDRGGRRTSSSSRQRPRPARARLCLGHLPRPAASRRRPPPAPVPREPGRLGRLDDRHHRPRPRRQQGLRVRQVQLGRACARVRRAQLSEHPLARAERAGAVRRHAHQDQLQPEDGRLARGPGSVGSPHGRPAQGRRCVLSLSLPLSVHCASGTSR